MPLCEYWLSGPREGTGFFVPYPLVRPSAGACGRFFPEPVRDGAERGRFRAFVCPVVCRVLTICKHVPTCPDKGARPAGRRAPGPLLFPRLTPSLFFQQASPPEAGLRLSSFGTAGSRPELPVSFAPRLPASLTPGRSGSPRPGSGDMVSYGRGVSSPGQDASGSPQVIPNNML